MINQPAIREQQNSNHIAPVICLSCKSAEIKGLEPIYPLHEGCFQLHQISRLMCLLFKKDNIMVLFLLNPLQAQPLTQLLIVYCFNPHCRSSSERLIKYLLSRRYSIKSICNRLLCKYTIFCTHLSSNKPFILAIFIKKCHYRCLY